MSQDYSDIIDLPHHVSETRPHMSMHDRAAQFSPFAALTGYDAAVKETARLTDQRVELDEELKQALSERLNLIQKNLSATPVVEITYFVPDDRKTGGAYNTVTGIVKKIDTFQRLVVLTDETDIPMDEIIEISGAMFQSLDDSFSCSTGAASITGVLFRCSQKKGWFTMQKKADGFKYDFTLLEMKALLFHSKKCLACSGQLTRERTCERVEGRDINSQSDPFFVQNAQVNHYGFLFRCQNCGRIFTLNALAEAPIDYEK